MTGEVTLYGGGAIAGQHAWRRLHYIGKGETRQCQSTLWACSSRESWLGFPYGVAPLAIMSSLAYTALTRHADHDRVGWWSDQGGLEHGFDVT